MAESPVRFRLCFRSLFEPGRGYAFPCDCNGFVVLDELSEQVRNNYLYARAMVGRELATPAIELEASPPPMLAQGAGRGKSAMA